MSQAVPPGDYSAKFLDRTTRLLGEQAVAVLRRKTVAIAGCGGVGGAAALTMARMGIGGFTLADPGRFDEPDANRQWAAAVPTLGRNKAEVYAESIRSIQPDAPVRLVPRGITDETIDEFLAGADFVVDGLDIAVPLPVRVRLYQRTSERGLHCISAPILGFGTLVMMAAPGGRGLDVVVPVLIAKAAAGTGLPAGLADYFFPDFLRAIEQHAAQGKVPSIAVAPALSASVSCVEALLVLLRGVFPDWRQPVCLPEILVVDAMRMIYRAVDCAALFGPLPAKPSAPKT